VKPPILAEQALLHRGVHLQRLTLAWNVVGVVVLGFGPVAARSVALAGFGLDSLEEIGASTVVLWCPLHEQAGRLRDAIPRGEKPERKIPFSRIRKLRSDGRWPTPSIMGTGGSVAHVV
jgi:hypothetical protein